jgi:hypothetical protein
VPDDVKVYTVSEPTVVTETVPVVVAADVSTGTLIILKTIVNMHFDNGHISTSNTF